MNKVETLASGRASQEYTTTAKAPREPQECRGGRAYVRAVGQGRQGLCEGCWKVLASWVRTTSPNPLEDWRLIVDNVWMAL